MFDSFKRLREIPLTFDKSFFLLLIIFPLGYTLFSGVASGIIALFMLPSIFFFALLHEYGHCWAAQKEGFQIYGIKLWFLGGLASIEDLDRATAKQEAIIAFAGPLVNLIIAWVFILLGFIISNNSFIVYIVVINLVLALFNLIPAYPMDGGRLLCSFLYYLLGNKLKATRISAQIGIVLATGFIITGLITANIMLILIFGWIGNICFTIVKNSNMTF